MNVIKMDKSQIEQGFTCRVCQAAVPASALYRVTCPGCRQTYAAWAPK